MNDDPGAYESMRQVILRPSDKISKNVIDRCIKLLIKYKLWGNTEFKIKKNQNT
jgi:hypothetical protein